MPLVLFQLRAVLRRVGFALVCVSLVATGLVFRPSAPAAAQVAGLECWFVADNGSPHTSNDLLTYYIDGVGESFIDGGSSPTDGTGTTSIEGMAGDPVTGIMYAANSGMFGTIDTVTGEFSAIGPTGFGDVDGLALDPFSREMYGVARLGGADELFKIDLATGALIPGGIDGLDSVPINSDVVVGLSDNDDIGISPYNGQMYAVANNGGPDRLILVDKDTGGVVDVGQITGATDIEGFSFDAFGNLLGSSGSQDNLYQMDLNTGAATFISDLNHFDYESIECSTSGFNTINGSVFLDKDGNGVFDGSDAGRGGVTVTLYRDANGDGLVDPGDPFLHSLVTAADGSYAFSFGATGDFVIDIDEATLPLSSTMTTDNVEAAAFAAAFGQSDAGNDFGYTVPPSLEIAKSSDAPADLAPGDTITYTIEVTNSGVTFETGIIVTDVLPPGTSYVPESTTATYGGGAGSSVFTDDFESGDFTGGTGPWTSNWLEIGESDGPSGGDIQIRQDDGADPPEDQDLAARIRDNDNGGEGIRRDLDLSPYGSAELNFDYRTHKLDNANDYITIDVSTNGGGAWTEIGRIAGPADSDLYASATYDLSPFLSPTASIRFRTSPSMGGGDEVWIDNVDITAGLAGSIVRTNATGDPDPLTDGVPPSLIVVADGVSIPATQSLIVTYQVIVDNPTAETDVPNTASASSDNSPFVNDTIVDPLTLSTIGDIVWDDLDGDGIQDGGEPGLAGVTVNLRNDVDAVIATTTTAGDGSYSFGGLGPADYVVEVIAPGGYSFTTQDAGADDAVDSDVAVGTGRSALFTLGRGVNKSDVDAGLFQAASIGDFIWDDLDGDGVQDLGEPGLAGVTVNLLDGGGAPLASTTTDGAGAYSFTGLTPGSYIIEVIPPAGFNITRLDAGGDAFDSDLIPATGRTAPITLTSGQAETTVDGGLFGTPAVGDFVWNDLDGDGIQDAGEPGMVGVTVNLLDLTDTVLATTTTNGVGLYAFTGLAPGSYKIEVIEPGGFALGSWDQGADDTVDSDIDGATGRSAPFTLASGEVDFTIDAALVAPSSIGDRVWRDNNGNGIQDGGELGLGGVTVNLLDGAGNPLASTTTDGAGAYSFAGIGPGDYIVEVIPPAGNLFSDAGQGADTDLDSDTDPVTGRTAVITLLSGENNPEIDSGLFVPPLIGDFVWEDLDADGLQDVGEPGLGGVTVNLLTTGLTVVDTTVTDLFGGYGFTNMVPGNYIIEVVVPAGKSVSPQDVGGDDTVDSDFDLITGRTASFTILSGEVNETLDAGLYDFVSIGDFVWEDLNGNGIQDFGEPGLAGVTVELRKDGSTIDSTVTAADGSYSFSGLVPGNYGIEVVAPVGYEFTGQDVGGNDADDSDVDPGNGRSVEALIGSGQSRMTVDAGLYRLVSIGDFVWDDLNANGIQDPGEPGLGGVDVNLLDGAGNLLDTDSSDGSGAYAFTDLHPGDYIIEVVGPAGYQISPQDVGGDDTGDSDIDQITGRTAVLSIASGENPVDIDGGLHALATIGDLVFEDRDGDGEQDGGDPGVAGVTMNLLDGAGNPLASTVTDINGNYSFSGLEPGDYQVEMVVPAAYVPGLMDAVADDSKDSDFDPVTNRSPVVTLVSGQNEDTIDAALVAIITIGDFVWDDLDADGIQDLGEPGVAGVTVNLLDKDGNFLESTVTDGSGLYSFDDLAPEEYIIEVIAPAGTSFSIQDAGADDDLDSDVDPSDGRTENVLLVSGVDDLSVDAGLVTPAEIGDFVWTDRNGNGIQEAGEPGLAGATVNLLDGAGNPLATTTTSGTGAYSFTGLAPGDYIIEVIPPGAFVFSPQEQGSDEDVDSDIDPATGRTGTMTLFSGDTENSVDAGMFRPPLLGDFVWDDLDMDGIQDPGEPGLAGVTVNLLDGAGNPVASTVTDGLGGYGFTDITPGPYIIEVLPPAGFGFTPQDVGADDTVDSDVDTTTGRSAPIILAGGDQDRTADAGLFTVASVGDFVWDDLNGDGIQDAGEPGLAGVTVNLLDGAGNPVSSTTTDGAGAYGFANLPPGDYIVEIVLPAGYQPSPPEAGFDGTVDSNIDELSNRSDVLTLVSGENNMAVDAGLFAPPALGDFVWDDLDADGIQDAGEPGIANVTVNLLDGVGNPLATTTTDLVGNYSFGGLAPGDYIVEVVVPAGYTFSPRDVGADDTIDSDADVVTGRSPVVSVDSGDSDPTLDAGVFAAASVGDFVWDDLDGDGVQDAGEPGLVGVTVNLLDGAGNPVASTTTDGAGAYSFTGVAPADYIVEVVAPAGYAFSPLDQGGDDTLDSDVAVATGRTPTFTLSSGENDITLDAGAFAAASIGDFVWDDLDGDGVQDAGEPGLVGVTVNLLDGAGNPVASTVTDGAGAYGFAGLTPGDYIVEVVAPAGYGFTAANAGGDDTVDSDVSVATGRTPTLSLASGETRTDVDAGAISGASIGDRVWDDLNANGRQDAGEPGLAGVTVNLLDGAGNPLASTTTDGSGNYSFGGLAPGDFIVELVTPAAYVVTLQDSGGDDTIDSDIDTGSGRTATITLGSGDALTDVDAGFFAPPVIGDLVWDDLDGDGIQDAGEPGLAGVTVNLLDGAGNPLASTVTDAFGVYGFTGLTPADYIIEFAPSGGEQFSPQDVGGDDAVDSDADVGTGRTDLITVASADVELTVDAGLFAPASIGDFVWDDLNADGIQDGGEPGLAAVTVNLLDGAGNPVASTTTDGAGAFSFGSLAPGDYIVEIVEPVGYQPSPVDQGADDAVDSDIAIATGRSGVVSLTSGAANDSVDAGLFALATIGDFVWDDLNADGIQDAGEPGLAAVTVNLLDGAGNPVATTTTDGTGAYSFVGLVAGDFIVEFVAPAGFNFVAADQGGDDAVDSDAIPATGRTAIRTLASGQIDTTVDAGLVAGASIGDFVWHDLDADGIQDVGEPGIANVTVNLLDGAGNPVATTTTDLLGAYAFTGLAPGDYIVEFIAPVAYSISPVDQGGDDTADSDADVITGRSPVVTLLSGETNTTIDAGVHTPASVGDLVWDDLDGDGIQDVGEPGLAGAMVNLLDGAGNPVASTTTDGAGNYTFAGVAPGDYIVEVVPPATHQPSPVDQGGDDTADSDINVATGRTATFTLMSADAVTTVDAGLFVPATIGDLVWDDLNANGRKDAGEPGLAGETVNLLDGAGNPVASTTTDAAGLYSFAGLVPGDYIVELVTPAGYTITTPDSGGDDTIDSDIDPVTGRSPVTTVASGDAIDDVDAGAFAPPAIGDFVWDDLDGDGIQDVGEPGLAGVTVNLLDGAGNPVASTVTDAFGAYGFTGLTPGSYIVEFVPSGADVFTTRDVGGDDAIDSDADPVTGRSATTTVISSDIELTVDAGLVSPASIGDFVWEDLDVDGIQDAGEPGLPGVTVNLLDGAGNPLASTTTDGVGAYSFTGLSPGDYIVEVIVPAGFGIAPADQGGDDGLDSDIALATGRSGPVTLTSGTTDASVDGGLYGLATIGDLVWDDLDADGIQNAGEPGLAGITVNLLDGAGNPVASTTTDALGAYQFANLVPGGYIVEVVPSAGYQPSPPDAGGDDSLDSDIAVATGRTPVVPLASGTVDPTIDAGLYALASIGDLVWDDLDGDGLQDAGEPGLVGVTVNLLDGAGNPVASTATDALGNYGFAGLVPADYIVEVVPPAGYAPTIQDAGVFDSVDSDIDGTGRTAPIPLRSGDTDVDTDGGLVAGAAIGDFVWDDLNGDGVQDAGEPGLAGVTVNLLDGAGNPVASTTTSGAGAYGFGGLAPGDYIVEVVPPAGYGPTTRDVGGDDTVDSDVDVVTGRTGVITLSSNEVDVDVDAGLLAGAAIGDFVWDDLNGDGVQDAGEPGLAGVTVNLLDGAGNPVASTTTDGVGGYSFTALAPGDYIVEVVEPAGYQPAPQNAGGDDAVDSDVDTGSGRTAVITLSSNETIDSVDAGLFEPVVIGDFVWDDFNANGIQDGGEPGLVGVTVNLLDGAGNSVASTTTDALGGYTFTGLLPGGYIIEVLAPAGYQPSPIDQGGDDILDSDIDPITSRTATMTLESGDVELTTDAGLFAPPFIGDFVWDDLDGDGLQDAGEPGLVGVTVNLLDGAGNPVASTLTDGAGAYGFSGLAPGGYIVEVIEPAGYVPSLVDQGGDDTIDSDVSLADGRSPVVTVVSNDVDLTIDAGLVEPTELGDFVWDDLDRDGRQDAGEPGLAGVTVNLLDGLGNPLASTVTDGSGAYSFTGLLPGDYIIEVVGPAGFSATFRDVGGDDAVDSDIDEVTGRTGVITISSGTPDETSDAGFFAPPLIGDLVWDDLDGDGVQDAGEPGLAGVTVNLLDDAGNPVASQVTDASGNYSFTGLIPGDYIVEVVVPAGYGMSPRDTGGDDALDSDTDPAIGRTGPITAASNDIDVTVDSGLFAFATLGNFVWDDLNGDGVQDAGEPGLAGVTVNLLDGAGNPVASTTTDGAGAYAFTGLAPGDYIVEVVEPAGYMVSPQDAAGDDALDSDIDLLTGQSAVVTLVSGDDVDSIDAGVFEPAAIGDFVWDDLNGDGVQDAGEPGLAGVTVNLLDGAGNPVASTTTDGSGAYGFTNLVPGDYIVEVIEPAGYAVTTPDAGADDGRDSDVDLVTGRSPIVTVVSGDDETSVDAGLVTPASVGDLVWDDLNGDGVQDAGEPGLAGVTVNLLDGVGNPVASTTTDGAGAYTFTGLAPGDYAIEVVAPAGYGASAQNAGGDDSLDSDIAGSGVTAVFTLESGDVDTSIDAGLVTGAVIGDFVWDDLNGDGVQDAGEPGLAGATVNLLDGAGNPLATTTTDVAGGYGFAGLPPGDYILEFATPAGYGASPQDIGGDDALDSDIDAVAGRTPVITLASGESNGTVDAGFIAPGTIGDLVWDDLNGDGVQDAGESGLAGVTVNLLDGAGNPVASTTTDGAGVYAFTGLVPGDYVVEVVEPAGYVVSPPLAGGDNTVDSDIDTGTGRSPIVTITSGQVETSIDGGLYTPPSIGDFVWDDRNGDGVQDLGEPGLAGVTVNLLDGVGNPVASTTTDGAGAYAFAGLVPGDYIVEVVSPAGFVVTTRDSGGDSLDSDIDDATGRTAVLTLESGDIETSIDAGVYTPPSIGDFVWDDLDRDGVQDGGEPGLAGVTVNLLDGAGNPVASMTTDGAGAYAFGGLVPGDYIVEVVTPVGYLVTTPGVGGDRTIDSDIDTGTGRTAIVTAAGGDTTTDIDAGFFVPPPGGDISGLVFGDLDLDGVLDATESGLANITVELLDAGGTVVATTSTGPGGTYQFFGIAAGDYTIDVDQDDTDMPPAYALTTANDPQGISVVDAVTSTADDIGYGAQASMAGVVAHDADHDGVLGSGDPRLSGQPITAIWAGPDGTAGTADDVTFTTTTDGAGAWAISGVPVGDYVIVHDGGAAPDGLDQPAFDPDAVADYTTAIALAAGENRNGLDFGVRGSATLGNLVFVDTNGNDVPDPTEAGLAGIAVIATWAGPDGVPGTGDDVAFPGVSGVDGSWVITDLPAGTFTVTIDPATVPDDYTGDPTFAVVLTTGEIANDVLPLDPAPTSPPLAVTGSSIMNLLLLAAMLLFVGAIATGSARRRRAESV